MGNTLAVGDLIGCGEPTGSEINYSAREWLSHQRLSTPYSGDMEFSRYGRKGKRNTNDL